MQTDAVQGAGSKAGTFPELGKPHLVLASPAGIATTTAGDTHIASDCHTAFTSGKSLSLAAGTHFFASIRQSFRLFVQKAGMKMVAAAGDIDLQALTDNIKLLAKLDITHTANRITITAKEEVVINGGGSYVKFEAGKIEFGTMGSFIAHATTHSLLGAKRGLDSKIPELSPLNNHLDFLASDAWVEFELVDQEGPVPGQRYILTDPGGTQHCGHVNELGIARIDKVPAGRCKVEFPDLDYTIEVESV